MVKIIVDQECHGKSLLHVLSFHFPDKQISKRALKRALDTNGCFLNGQMERYASKKVFLGDQIHFDSRNIKNVTTSLPSYDKKRLLYEDDYLIAYDKPPHISVDNEGLERVLPFKAPLVHRLDKETSGVILFAKSEEASKSLQKLFKKRSVEKEYIALLDGVSASLPKQCSTALEAYHPFPGKVLMRLAKKNGEKALTYISILKKGQSSMLVSFKPVTGRTHQIRLHALSLGHPILGDYTYCRQFSSNIFPKRVMLHSKKISFDHPVTNERITCEAQLPDDFSMLESVCMS